ncbi:MAG: HEAT repeat domain-containing protein [Planctomycetota bacterium]|nr:HEAT repeat domain-containing protein [Planctomycetota bacterium]
MKRTTGILLVALLLCGLGLAAGAPTARADADADAVAALKLLQKQKTPAGRLKVIRTLITVGGDRAARALARLVQRDASAEVRVGAARALGLIKSDVALRELMTLVQAGGPRAVRAAVGRALGRRTGAVAEARKILEGRRAGRIERALMLRALGFFRDAESLDVLRAFARHEDVHLRGEAVRAIVTRVEMPAKRRALVRSVLAGGRTVDELMPALDAAAEILDPSLEDVLQRVSTFLERPLRESSEHLLDNLTSMAADAAAAEGGPKKAAPKKPKPGRYADGGPPPTDGPPPLPRMRGMTDTMYVVDATGSTNSTLAWLKARILHDMEVLLHAGVNVRVGILLYRGGRVVGGPASPFEVVPLPSDIHRLGAFLESVKPRGVDDRGARVGAALEQALARSSWRWRARRTVHFYADGPCGDIHLARRVVGIHFRADRTRTRFTYVTRTRNSVPEEYAELARLGGTGVAEVLR